MGCVRTIGQLLVYSIPFLSESGIGTQWTLAYQFAEIIQIILSVFQTFIL